MEKADYVGHQMWILQVFPGMLADLEKYVFFLLFVLTSGKFHEKVSYFLQKDTCDITQIFAKIGYFL